MGKIPQGKQRELPEEGTHNAICVQVIDMGTQKVTYEGKEKSLRQIQLAFQLVDEQTSEGEAMVVYKKFTFSGHSKSALMIALKAWLSVKDPEYDMENVLGKPALITIAVSTNDKGSFANISNIGGVPKGTKVTKASEPFRSLFLNDGEFDEETFKVLPEYLKLKIADSPEYAEVIKPKSKPVKGQVSAKPAGKKK